MSDSSDEAQTEADGNRKDWVRLALCSEGDASSCCQVPEFRAIRLVVRRLMATAMGMNAR